MCLRELLQVLNGEVNLNIVELLNWTLNKSELLANCWDLVI